MSDQFKRFFLESFKMALNGFKPAQKKAKYLEADKRIFNLVLSFDNNSDVLEFLKGISNNCKFDD